MDSFIIHTQVWCINLVIQGELFEPERPWFNMWNSLTLTLTGDAELTLSGVKGCDNNINIQNGAAIVSFTFVKDEFLGFKLI